jgi:hypothetical protein
MAVDDVLRMLIEECREQSDLVPQLSRTIQMHDGKAILAGLCIEKTRTVHGADSYIVAESLLPGGQV